MLVEGVWVWMIDYYCFVCFNSGRRRLQIASLSGRSVITVARQNCRSHLLKQAARDASLMTRCSVCLSKHCVSPSPHTLPVRYVNYFILYWSVRKGSVLGPLLFISYAAEVSDVFDRHGGQSHLFADDKHRLGSLAGWARLTTSAVSHLCVQRTLQPGVPLAAFSSMPRKLNWSGLDRVHTSQDYQATICRSELSQTLSNQ